MALLLPKCPGCKSRSRVAKDYSEQHKKVIGFFCGKCHRHFNK